MPREHSCRYPEVKRGDRGTAPFFMCAYLATLDLSGERMRRHLERRGKRPLSGDPLVSLLRAWMGRVRIAAMAESAPGNGRGAIPKNEIGETEDMLNSIRVKASLLPILGIMSLLFFTFACHRRRVVAVSPTASAQPYAPAPAPPGPPSCTLTAEPATVDMGKSVTLTWSSE